MSIDSQLRDTALDYTALKIPFQLTSRSEEPKFSLEISLSCALLIVIEARSLTWESAFHLFYFVDLPDSPDCGYTRDIFIRLCSFKNPFELTSGSEESKLSLEISLSRALVIVIEARSLTQESAFHLFYFVDLTDSLTAAKHKSNVLPYILSTNWTHQSLTSSQQRMTCCHHR